MDDVRLPELATIQKYSIAVRAEYAPADEVIAALRSDLETLTKGSGGAPGSGTSRTRSTKKKKATTKRSTARKR